MSEPLSACPPPLHEEEISKYALSSFSLRKDRGVAVVYTHKGPFPDEAVSDLQPSKQVKEPATFFFMNNVGNCDVTGNCDVVYLWHSEKITTEKIRFFTRHHLCRKIIPFPQPRRT